MSDEGAQLAAPADRQPEKGPSGLISATVAKPVDEPLAVLLLPGKLETFELQSHARDLLAIPRVIALEPSRVPTPRFLRDAASLRQAKRLKLPGLPRLLVLYHPAQYPLVRALCSRYENAELWYVAPGPEALEAAGTTGIDELREFDQLARGLARQAVPVTPGDGVRDESLRARLRELEVISSRPFVPGGRVRGR